MIMVLYYVQKPGKIKMGCEFSKCPLHGKSNPVKYVMGAKNGLVFLGEYPGYTDEKNGPFHETGGTIHRYFGRVGLNTAKTTFMYSLRCRVPVKDVTERDISKAMKFCKVHMEKAFSAVSPKLVIMSGKYALKQMTGKTGKKYRGQWFREKNHGFWMLPTDGIVFVKKNGESLGAVFEANLNMVVSAIKNNCEPVMDLNKSGYREVSDLSDMLGKKILVGMDTETQGLKWMNRDFVPISVSFSDAPKSGYDMVLYEENQSKNTSQMIEYMKRSGFLKKMGFVNNPYRTIQWPRGRKTGTVHVKPAPNFVRKIKDLWALIEDDNIKKVFMNKNFDVHVLDNLFGYLFGKTPKYRGIVGDIQAFANLMDENQFQKPNLVSLQMAFTDETSGYDQLFGEKWSKADMLAVPNAERTPYACADSDLTRQVFTTQWGVIKQNPKLANYAQKFIMPTLASMAVMERNGALVDMERLPQVSKKLGLFKSDLETKMLKLVPKRVLQRHEGKTSFTRAEFKQDIVFNGFGLKKEKRSKKTGEPSFDKEARKVMLDEAVGDAHEFLTLYDQWSEVHVLITRYLNGFKKAICDDGRIHTKFSLSTTVSGRSATSDPNMQNIPKRGKLASEIRSLIIPPHGYVLMGADESQSELRWLTFLCADPEMQKIYQNGGDIHRETAVEMARRMGKDFDSLPAKEQKDIRTMAKPVNFGVIYLISPKGLKTNAKTTYGVDMSETDSEEYIKAFFGKYKNVPEYHRRTIDFTRKNGYIDSVLGRRRRLPDIYSDNAYLRGDAERQSVNFPISEPSSSTVLIAQNMMEETGYDPDEFRPIMFIHDELVAEVREDKIDKYARLMHWALTNPNIVFQRDFGFEMTVPLESDIKVGYNLSDMNELKKT